MREAETGSCAPLFLQAEDGLRDADVTGVQTCALPIWAPQRPPARTATLIGSPRTAGPQPRDVLRLAPPHSPAPLDHGERLPEARRVLDREAPNAVHDAPEESRQDASPPYLDEGRGGLRREAQDTIRPPDPARELLEEEGPDLRRGAGHARVDVAHHGDRRVGDRDPVELAGELDGGRR